MRFVIMMLFRVVILELPLGKRRNVVMYNYVGSGIPPENSYLVIVLYNLYRDTIQVRHPINVLYWFREFGRLVMQDVVLYRSRTIRKLIVS